MVMLGPCPLSSSQPTGWARPPTPKAERVCTGIVSEIANALTEDTTLYPRATEGSEGSEGSEGGKTYKRGGEEGSEGSEHRGLNLDP